MRITRLILKAFGPFTNEELDLRGGAPGGLHLIYGPNEAGKSTSLRAVSALLFGMPHQSQDAHVHPSSDLRVEAQLSSEAGELFVSRLKRRKDSLVDASGVPLHDDALLPFLQGLDQESFETRFGLDQDVLERGAHALLGGSEEGVFSAGTAGAGVASALRHLDEEMGAIYRPRGQKYRLNTALSRLADADKALRFAERPPEKYQERKQAHDAALAEVARLETEQQETRQKLGRLGRLRSVLTEVSLWADARAELSSLVDVPLLPPDAEERRQSISATVREAELQTKAHAAELDRLQQALQALPPLSGLVDAPEDRLALLRNQIGSELKARADLPKRRAKLLALNEEVDRVKAQLGRADASVDSLLIDAPKERRLRALIATREKIAQSQAQLERVLSRLALDRQELEQTGAPAGSTAELGDAKAALQQAREMQSSARQRAATEEKAKQLELEETRLREELAPVGELSQVDFEELDQLLEEWRDLAKLVRSAKEAAQAARRAADSAETKAKLLREALDIPTDEALVDARRQRDETVSLIGTGDAASPLELLRQIRASVVTADQLADRLRREAIRVSEHASLLLAAEDAREQATAAEQDLAHHAEGLRLAQESYDSYFARAGISPPPPRQARGVARRVKEALEVSSERRRCQEELSRQRQAVERVCERLRVVLGKAPKGACLDELAARLESVVEAHATEVLAQRSRAEQLRKLERREREEAENLEQQKAQLAIWEQHWGEAMNLIGRAPDASIDEVEAYLLGLSSLASQVAEMREMKRRVDGIERDTASFQELLFGIARTHAKDLLQGDLIESAEALLARAREADEHQRERGRLKREIEERQTHLHEAQQRLLIAESALGALMADAKVSEPQHLAQALQSSARKRELTERLSDLHHVLRSRSAGRAIEDLVGEVQGLDHDELQASTTALEARQEEVDEELRLAQRESVELGRGLLTYASTDAAEARQRVSERRATAEAELRAYLVRKAAWTLLTGEIERYAAEHQGPILERAKAHFSQLTLGRYTGLRVGAGERVLRCVRDGKDVEVDGLSRGTRAQLYFALRVASLERYFEHRAPVPLLLDDLFVDFDDDRTASAFELLGELSLRTQILYYTHLARDVEAADAAVPKGRLFLHKLGVD